MTGPEHYREAERLLAQASDVDLNGETYFLGDTEQDVAAAQVHATLALAAAAAYPAVRDYLGDEASDSRDWTGATARKPQAVDA